MAVLICIYKFDIVLIFKKMLISLIKDFSIIFLMPEQNIIPVQTKS